LAKNIPNAVDPVDSAEPVALVFVTRLDPGLVVKR
jgi:hypothetical protein